MTITHKKNKQYLDDLELVKRYIKSLDRFDDPNRKNNIWHKFLCVMRRNEVDTSSNHSFIQALLDYVDCRE